MTDRSEIERLLNQTGRTLEGLPKVEIGYGSRTNGKTMSIIKNKSDVIELLVGALRYTLDTRPKWISVEEREPEFPCICYEGVNTIRIPKNIVSLTLKSGEKVFVSDAFLVAFPHALFEELDDCTHILYWMPLPEPPEEDKHEAE